MQECIESASQLVVSSGDAAKLLEPAEETFDQMPGFVAVPIDSPFMVAVVGKIGDRPRFALA